MRRRAGFSAGSHILTDELLCEPGRNFTAQCFLKIILEHISKTSEENDHTSEVQEADVVFDEVIEASSDAAELL